MCCYLVPLAQCHIGSAWRVKLALVISRSVGHSYLLCTCCMPGPALGARNEKNGNSAPGANTSTDTCPPWCSQAILFLRHRWPLIAGCHTYRPLMRSPQKGEGGCLDFQNHSLLCFF